MNLILWGIGGVTSSALSILEKDSHSYQNILLIQDSPEEESTFMGYPVIGNRSLLDQYSPSQYDVFPAGSTPATRKVMAHYLQKRGFHSPTLISPHAIVRRTAKIGKGCIIQAFALIDHFTHIEDFTLIGDYTAVGHHSHVGAYSSLYVGTRLLGHTEVGEHCLMGAGSYLFAYRSMGEGSSASMGSIIFENVPAFAKVAGNPATLIKQYTGYKPAILRDIST